MLKISIIVSDQNHPVFNIVNNWVLLQKNIDIELVNRVSQLREQGDFLFLVSCSEIINSDTTDCFTYSLVLHASDLPKGRGWSPHIWDIVNGADHITLSLLEAKDKVDTGRIWLKKTIQLNGNELYQEINNKLFMAEIELIEKAIFQVDNIQPKEQDNNVTPYYHPKRTPRDSELDPFKTFEQQFNLLRVCDNERFPAFIEMHGQKYTVKLEKIIE